MQSLSLRFLSACFALVLLGCLQNTPTGSSPPLSGNELPKAWPKSAELESRWGKPEGPFRSMAWYATKRYKDPKIPERYVEVAYVGQQQPRETRNHDDTRAVDGRLQVMGQTVDFYSSGNEIAEISTHPVLLKAPSGWSGWFVFIYSPKEYHKGRNLPEFSW